MIPNLFFLIVSTNPFNSVVEAPWYWRMIAEARVQGSKYQRRRIDTFIAQSGSSELA